MTDGADIEVTSGANAGRLWPAGEPEWAGFTIEERQAVVVLVRDSLNLLLEDVEGWLPGHVERHPPTKLALRIVWDLTSVESEILKLRAAAEVQEMETISQLRRLALSAD